MAMSNFHKIAAVTFLLILGKCYAKPNSDCNEKIQGVWLGNDANGTPVCGYPLNRKNFPDLQYMENSLTATNCFDEGYKESFRVFWVKKESDENKGVSIAIPIETLTTCGQFPTRGSKLKAMKEFMVKMETVESGIPEEDQKLGRACYGPYGVIARSLYAHNKCEIDSIELLHNNIHYEGSTYTRNDIKALRKSIEELGKSNPLTNYMADYFHLISLGCYHTEMTGADQCIVYSMVKTNSDKVRVMFYHMHCCCEDASKCSADVRSEGKPILVFCPRDVRRFVANEGGTGLDPKVPYMCQEDSSFSQVIPLDENVMSEACYSKIVIKRTQYDGNTTKEFLQANITVHYGDDCLGSGKSECIPIGGDMDGIFPEKLEYCCTTLIDANAEKDDQWKSLTKSTNEFLGNEGGKDWWPISVKLFDAIARCAYLPYKVRQVYKSPLGGDERSTIYWCFFFYDDEKREVMNIWPDDQDYLPTLSDASGYDFEGEYRVREKNFDFRGPEEHFKWLFSVDNTVKCRLVGGCKRRLSAAGVYVKSNCTNFQMAFTMCRCMGEEEIPKYAAGERYADKPYIPCDVIMATELKKGAKNYTTLVPYCNVGKEHPVIQATTHPYQFYCYASKTRDEKDKNKYTWDYGFYNVSVSTELYKYNEDEEQSERKCDHPHGSCTYNGKTMFCCCLANYYDPQTIEKNVAVCNNDSIVTRYEEEKLLFKFEELGNTRRARRKCVSPTGDDSSGSGNSTSVNLREMGFEVFIRPLCYFSIPVSKLGTSSANVEQYFYDSQDRDRNLGPFRTLCDTKKWGTEEHVNGCACRLVFVEWGENEMGCCCDVAAAQKYNEHWAQNKKLILASKFGRQKPPS